MSARAVLTASCVALGAGPALAGALDRSGQPIAPLFEPGGYAELNFRLAYPDVSTTSVAPIAGIPAGAESGDLTERFADVGAAVKLDFGERVSAALIYDQPFGADVDYPNRIFFAAGSDADLDSDALTALLRYRFDNGFSVHGGLRLLSLGASATIPFVQAPAGPTAGQPYEVVGRADEGVGTVVGAAYEIPEIALRVALTYSSEIALSNPTTESGPIPRESETEVEAPQSVRLDFQSGVAEDTLVFGSIRWVDWSDFDIAPSAYVDVTGQPLLFYPNDVTTFTLGVGRQFTDRFSAAVAVSYEDQSDDFVTNLGPVSGLTAIGVAGTYEFDAFEVTGSVQYGRLGDARTALTDPATGQRFQAVEAEDNDVVALGLQLAYRF